MRFGEPIHRSGRRDQERGTRRMATRPSGTQAGNSDETCETIAYYRLVSNEITMFNVWYSSDRSFEWKGKQIPRSPEQLSRATARGRPRDDNTVMGAFEPERATVLHTWRFRMNFATTRRDSGLQHGRQGGGCGCFRTNFELRGLRSVSRRRPRCLRHELRRGSRRRRRRDSWRLCRW